MQKDNLKKEIVVLMERFININFEDFIADARFASDSTMEEVGLRQAIDHTLEIFITIKNNDSILDAFKSSQLITLKSNLEQHIPSITSVSTRPRSAFHHLVAMDKKLAPFKLDEVIKKISLTETKDDEVTKEASLTETEEAIKYFQDNKETYKRAKEIFEQAIKNKDDFIGQNLSKNAEIFDRRRRKIEYIINIEKKKKSSLPAWLTKLLKSWPMKLLKLLLALLLALLKFLNLRNFWWFALGLVFAGGALGFLWTIQSNYGDGDVINPITTGLALIRISFVAILMSLLSFCFLQFSYNKKLIEFYEFKAVALNAFKTLYQDHSNDPEERRLLFTRAFDVIFKEYSFRERSFKGNDVKNIPSQMKDLKDLTE